MSFIINTKGDYVGLIRNGRKDIFVIAANFSNIDTLPFSSLSEKEKLLLLSQEQATPLVGTSEKKPGYQLVIDIPEYTWKAIEKQGGKRQSPVFYNNSSTIVYIKPEYKVLRGPGKIIDHRKTIAVAPGEKIYGRIDGVKTEWKKDQIFKAVNGTKLVVLPEGKIKIVAYKNLVSRLGQLLIGGWKKWNGNSAWENLANRFKETNDPTESSTKREKE